MNYIIHLDGTQYDRLRGLAQQEGARDLVYVSEAAAKIVGDDNWRVIQSAKAAGKRVIVAVARSPHINGRLT